MSQVLTLEESPQLNRFQHPFLQELVKQFRLADTFRKYRHQSDELLIEQLIISSDRAAASSKTINLDSFNQLLTYAFYQAIGATIERITGHTTDTFVYLKGKEFSSAVICCGGVLVLYSLIWGHSVSFPSLKELVETSESNISKAIAKASQYLEFVE